MIYSLERVFDGTLDISYMLNKTIPDLHQQYAEVIARVRAHGQTLAARLVGYLNDNRQILRKMHPAGHPHTLVGCLIASEDLSKVRGNEKALELRLHNLNQWTVSTLSSRIHVGMLLRLASCNVLVRLISDILQH